MKKLIILLSTLTLAVSPIISQAKAETINGWTVESVQKTFIKGKDLSPYQQCMVTALISNFNPQAYNTLKNSRSTTLRNKLANTSFSICGFSPEMKEWKNTMDNLFHKEVKPYTHGTETITAEFPQISDQGRDEIKYYFQWVNQYGEQKIDIYYCSGTNANNFNCQDAY